MLLIKKRFFYYSYGLFIDIKYTKLQKANKNNYVNADALKHMCVKAMGRLKKNKKDKMIIKANLF